MDKRYPEAARMEAAHQMLRLYRVYVAELLEQVLDFKKCRSKYPDLSKLKLYDKLENLLQTKEDSQKEYDTLKRDYRLWRSAKAKKKALVLKRT